MASLAQGQYKFVSPYGDELLMGAQTSIRVLKTTGLVAQPTLASKFRDKSGAHGGFTAGPSFMLPRQISMDIQATATKYNPVEQIMDRMFAVLQTWDLPGALYFRRNTKQVRRVEAQVVEFGFETGYQQWQGDSPGMLLLRCQDPRVYEETLRLNTLSSTVGGVGRTYPKTYPYVYGSPGSGGSGLLTNLGNIDAPMTIVIPGPVVDPSLIHVESQRKLDFQIDIPSGEFLYIDTDDHTVLLNGLASRRGSLRAGSRWPALQPGDNHLSYDSFDSSGSSAAQIFWRSAWLSG